MNSRNIGKIISIGVNGIIAEVYESMGNYISTKDGLRFVGEVGSYVSIYDVGRTIIAEVIGVNEKPHIDNQPYVKPNSYRQIYLNLLGEIIDSKFFFGVSKMPLIFAEVHVISEKELMAMLEVENEEISIRKNKTRAISLPIGKSVIFPDYMVRINIDKFFGFHFAVFGNTGAGKSNTIALILQSIFMKKEYAAKGAKFVVIDSNGEYSQAFSKIHNNNKSIKVKSYFCDSDALNNKLEIPIWALSADDWAILLHASEKTQIPILKRAIDIAKIFNSNTDGTNDLKNHILACTILGVFNSSDSSPSKSDKLKSILTMFNTDEISLDTKIRGTITIEKKPVTADYKLRELLTIGFGNFNDQESAMKYFQGFVNTDLISSFDKKDDVPYDLDQFAMAVTFATLYEGSVSSQRIQEYTATLLTRLQAIQDGIQGTFFTKTRFLTVDEYIKNTLGNNQIVNIDISCLDDASSEVVTKVLAKLILDYLKKQKIKANMPVNFIIEEAHRFVKNESAYGATGYNIFERISKEGRKYGMLLGISSQRPSELSKTVVSQCSNFIIHRVQNPDDLQYISKMVPYINQNIIDRLTYLQTGHALIFGTAINLPTLTHFEQAIPPTDSQNARVSEKWYVK